MDVADLVDQLDDVGGRARQLAARIVDHAARGAGARPRLLRGGGDALAAFGQPHGLAADRLDRRRLLGHAPGEFGDIGLKIERPDAEIARHPRRSLDGLRDVQIKPPGKSGESVRARWLTSA